MLPYKLFILLIKKNALREKYNIPINKFVLLHVGHASECRGLNDLIEFAKINNDYHIIIIILSSLYDMNALCGEDYIPSNVTIINKYVSAIDEYYKLSDIYVFPAKITNSAIDYPLSIFEALALGKHVIATNSGGNKEIVIDNKTGFIVQPFNVEEVVCRVNELLNDKEKRVRMGKAGRKRIENEFNLNKMIAKFIELYKTIYYS